MTRVYRPAPTSSSTTPAPPCKFCNRRHGDGFSVSKLRKSIKLRIRYCQRSGTATSAINCPATSSITIWDGSVPPLSRSTIVAAGMPTTTSRAAATDAASQCHSAPVRYRAASHQTSSPTADPQVPGAGRRKPTPKKVATSHAQVVRGGPPASGTALARCTLRTAVPACCLVAFDLHRSIRLVRVVDGT